jgi:DNA transformation protein and related proteins
MDVDRVKELFASFGPVDVRRMFGGMGVFADGVMLALISREIIHLKVDEHTVAAFEREELGVFEYSTKEGMRSLTSYRRMPERLYDDPDELAAWARLALAAARRSAAGEGKKAGRGTVEAVPKPPPHRRTVADRRK